jgi:hypothetical protein
MRMESSPSECGGGSQGGRGQDDEGGNAEEAAALAAMGAVVVGWASWSIGAMTARLFSTYPTARPIIRPDIAHHQARHTATPIIRPDTPRRPQQGKGKSVVQPPRVGGARGEEGKERGWPCARVGLPRARRGARSVPRHPPPQPLALPVALRRPGGPHRPQRGARRSPRGGFPATAGLRARRLLNGRECGGGGRPPPVDGGWGVRVMAGQQQQGTSGGEGSFEGHTAGQGLQGGNVGSSEGRTGKGR